MTGDVFKEHPFRSAFGDDTGDIRPEVPGIVGTAAFASGAEGLAGISGEDDVKGTAERPGIEAAEIAPDWGRRKIPGALGGNEHSAGPVFPFDESAGVISGLGEHEAHIKASAACAEG